MRSAMRVTGLCGGIGAGKSTVALMLAEHGALIIDVDAIGRQVLLPGGRAYNGVIEAFGEDILESVAQTQPTGDGQRAIDRAKLGAIVFADPAQMARLEAVSHPAINSELDDRLVGARLDGVAWVVLDMAVLVESSLGQNLPSGLSYDTVLVVEAPAAIRQKRLIDTRGMSEADAEARIASQATDDERRAVADFVVVNDGDLAQLRRTVDAIVPALSGHRGEGGQGEGVDGTQGDEARE